MKKIALGLAATLLASGCGNLMGILPAAPAASHASAVQLASANAATLDLGYSGGRTATLHFAAPLRKSIQDLAAFTGWTAADVNEYVVTIADTADLTKVLGTITVSCQGGDAEAIFTHLQPGRAYQVAVVAKGNKGGTSPDYTLNTQKAATGEIDLSKVDASSGAQEFDITVPVQLDGAYDRQGVIAIQPLDGQTFSGTISGSGVCSACGDPVITDGSTHYDSVATGYEDADVFSTDSGKNRWMNATNGSATVERDFSAGDTYDVSEIDIDHANSDLRYAPCKDILVQLEQTDGTWLTVDEVKNANLVFYRKALDTAVTAKAFRLQMTDANGWFSASAFALRGKATPAASAGCVDGKGNDKCQGEGSGK